MVVKLLLVGVDRLAQTAISFELKPGSGTRRIPYAARYTWTSQP